MTVQEISPEAAIWVARRGMVLDLINEAQPADRGHNKRLAAEITRLMQEWESNVERIVDRAFRERYDLLRQVEAAHRLADEMEHQAAGGHDEDDDAYRDAATRIRQALGGRQ